jgi:hypothetical protein
MNTGSSFPSYLKRLRSVELRPWPYDRTRLIRSPRRRGEQLGRDFEAECFGGRNIDNEIEFVRLFDRNVGRFCTTQNLVDRGPVTTGYFSTSN